MSCKTKVAYIKVLTAIKELTEPYGQLQLEKVSLDFEIATWLAFKTVFPGIRLEGCAFHFSQAVFRKILELGLASFYRNSPRINKLCRKLMTLNLLPHRFIKPTFQDLKREARGTLTKQLLEYFENTWIKHRTWKPCTWSVFMLAMRTNNPVEGYHARLKRLAKKPELNLYLLIELLYHESKMVPMKCYLLGTNKLCNHQKKYCLLHLFFIFLLE